MGEVEIKMASIEESPLIRRDPLLWRRKIERGPAAPKRLPHGRRWRGLFGEPWGYGRPR